MLLGAYLLTGPHSNGIGTFRVPAGYIQDDLGWDRERVTETLSELSAKGFCKVFGKVVHIPKFLRWNPIANGNVAKARQAEFESVPSDQAKQAAARAMLDFGNHWADGFRNRLETLSKRYAEQEPTQPNPTQPNPTREEGRAADAASPPQKKQATSTGSGKNQVPRPDFIDEQVWSDFLAHRRQKKAKLTPTAWKQIEKEIRAGIESGHGANDMLAEAMAAGWQGFKLEWYENRIARAPARGSNESPAERAAREAVEYRKRQQPSAGGVQ